MWLYIYIRLCRWGKWRWGQCPLKASRDAGTEKYVCVLHCKTSWLRAAVGAVGVGDCKGVALWKLVEMWGQINNYGGFVFWVFFKTFFFIHCFIFIFGRKTSVSIHIITLYISMIRAEENYSRLTVVEEIIWRRERLVRTHAHTHTRTHRHTHTLRNWIGKSGEVARVS